MKVAVALEDHFLKCGTEIYSSTVFSYEFWQRYLAVFDDVVVFARVSHTNSVPPHAKKANGNHVTFFEIPEFVGPWQFLKSYSQLNTLAKEVISQADAFILRIPGTIGTVLWKELSRQNKMYGVEVVGDPWDSFAPGSVRSIARPIVRHLMQHYMKRQCANAMTASYVTEFSLQKRYPPGGWSTHYSSIELPEQAIANDLILAKKLSLIDDKLKSNRPWHLCYAGTMEQLYKAPDILIKAVARCISDGLELELTLLGDGQFRSQLESLAKQLGIYDKTYFLGKIPAGNPVYEQFDKADIYILPSRQEGLPRSAIEAMARGLPCIGSTVGGFPELLDADFLVSPGEVDILANRIQMLINRPDLLKAAVARNIDVARRYTSAILENRRKQFYQKTKETAGNFAV